MAILARYRGILTQRGRGFLVVGVVLLVSGLLLGVVDLVRTGVLAVALPAIAVVVAQRSRLDLDVRRQAVPARVQPDEPSRVELLVGNPGTGRMPTLMAEDLVDYALGDRPRMVIPRLSAADERVVRYSVRSHSRGRHQLGPLTLRLTDTFGLTQRVSRAGPTTDILVLPRVHPLARGGVRGSQLGAEGVVPHQVALHGEDDVSIREYRDGDELRRIHWPATARTGHLMVRQEDRPATRRATLLLDARASAHRGSGPSGSFEWSVSAAASIAIHLMEQGYALHLLTSEDERRSDGRAATDLDRSAALDVLADIAPSDDEEFTRLLHSAGSTTAPGGLVICIVGPLDEVDSRTAGALRPPGATGLAIVIDPTPAGVSRGQVPQEHRPADRTATILRTAGWAAAVARHGDAVGEVWRRVSGAPARGGR